MKRLAITSLLGLAVVGLIAFVWLWSPFAPSIIVIRNIGDRPADLGLTDADASPVVWSGTLAPDRRKTVVVWFKNEGAPEIRCRDSLSRSSEAFDYVTPHTAIFGEIAVNGCADIAIKTGVDPF